MSPPTTRFTTARAGGVQSRIATLETQSSSGSIPEPQQQRPDTDRVAVSDLARFKHRRRPLQQRSRLEATAAATGGSVESHLMFVVKKDARQQLPIATTTTTTVTQQASAIRRSRLGLRHGLPNNNDAMSIDTSTTPQTTSSTMMAADSVQSAPQPIRTSSTTATRRISQTSPLQKSQQHHHALSGGGYTSSGGESHSNSSCASNSPLHPLRHGTARVARSHKKMPTNTTATGAAAVPETSLQRTPIVAHTTTATTATAAQVHQNRLERFERSASVTLPTVAAATQSTANNTTTTTSMQKATAKAGLYASQRSLVLRAPASRSASPVSRARQPTAAAALQQQPQTAITTNLATAITSTATLPTSTKLASAAAAAAARHSLSPLYRKRPTWEGKSTTVDAKLTLRNQSTFSDPLTPSWTATTRPDHRLMREQHQDGHPSMDSDTSANVPVAKHDAPTTLRQQQNQLQLRLKHQDKVHQQQQQRRKKSPSHTTAAATTPPHSPPKSPFPNMTAVVQPNTPPPRVPLPHQQHAITRSISNPRTTFQSHHYCPVTTGTFSLAGHFQ
jgi:hypothetical protein